MRYFGVRSIKEEVLFGARGRGDSCERLADPSQFLLRPMKVGVRQREVVRDVPRLPPGRGAS